MRRVIWRGLRANVGRFLLTLLAVTLGVAFLSGTLALRSVLASSFEATLASVNTYPLYVQGGDTKNPLRSGVAVSEVDKIRHVAGVKAADPVYATAAPVLGPDKTPLAVAGSSLVLQGLREGATDWPQVGEGSAPHGSGEIGLERSAATRLDLAVGDTIYLVAGADLKPMRITALYDYETAVALIAVGIVTPDVAKEMLGDPATVSQIGVVPTDGTSLATLTRALGNALGDDVSVWTATALANDANKEVNDSLGFVNTFLLVFVAIAFFVGIFIITNTFRMSVRAEQRQFATLRALGATARQVFAVVALQGLIIGLAGSILGVAAGAGLIAALAALLDAQFGVPLGDVEMPPDVIVISLVVGMIVTFLGAVLPAREAALTPPVEAMRSGESREKPLLVRGIIGGIVGGGGVLAILVTVWQSSPSGALLGVGVAALVGGALMLGPVLAKPLMSLLALPMRLIRPLGRLGLRNALANPRRSALTSAALMVGVMLVTAGSVVAATVRESTGDVIDSQLKADLIISALSSQGVSPEVAEKIEKMDGVATVSRDLGAVYGPIGVEGAEPSADLIATLPANYDTYFTLNVTKGSIADFVKNPSDSLLIGKGQADSTKLGVGDTLVLAGAGDTRRLTIRAVVESLAIPQNYMIAPEVAKELQVPAAPTTQLLVMVDKGHTVASVKKAITDTLEPLHTYQVLDRDQYKGQLAKQVDTVLGVLYALLGLSIIIAVLGIVNTLSLSISERVREIGLLRAVGMSRWAVSVMIVLESILISVFGAFLGLGLGTYAAYGLCTYLSNRGLGTMVIPWDMLVMLALAAVVVGAAAAILPAVKAVRYRLLDAIARH